MDFSYASNRKYNSKMGALFTHILGTTVAQYQISAYLRSKEAVL